MKKIVVFNNLSVDGMFCDAMGGVNWSKRDDGELTEYVRQTGSEIGAYVFGRVTYEMFAGFWPTPAGKSANPYFAKLLTEGKKVVFSSKLKKASWERTVIETQADAASIARLKASTDGDCLVFGSGTLVRDLTNKGLIDEYQVVLNPVLLGGGRPLFGPMPSQVELEFLESKPFSNGTVLLRFARKYFGPQSDSKL